MKPEIIEFSIAGEQGFIKITIQEVFGFPDETSYLGDMIAIVLLR